MGIGASITDSEINVLKCYDDTFLLFRNGSICEAVEEVFELCFLFRGQLAKLEATLIYVDGAVEIL